MSDEQKFAKGGYVSESGRLPQVSLGCDYIIPKLKRGEVVIPADLLRRQNGPTPGNPNHLSD